MQDFKAVHTIDSSGTGGRPNGGRWKIDKLTITLQDDANTTDFYEVKTFDAFINNNGTGVLDTFLRQNQLLSNSPGVETDYNSSNALLSDNTFNGQNFSFYVNNSQFDNQPPNIYYVRVYKITKERYLYLKSVRRQQQSGNGSNPFAEPSFVYSNMPNGFGIFSFGLGRTVQAELR